MSADILLEVQSIIADQLNVPIERLAPDTKIGDLGGESLDIILIIFALEEKFGIDIPLRAEDASRLGSGGDNTESENLALLTIAGIVDAVKERVDAKARS
jgi:acyl carrier protein